MTRRIADGDHDLDIGRLPSLRHRMKESLSPMAASDGSALSAFTFCGDSPAGPALISASWDSSALSYDLTGLILPPHPAMTHVH
jgi:hypothetical protein